MNVRTTLLTTAVLLAGVAAVGLPRSEATQLPQTIPQSLRLECLLQNPPPQRTCIGRAAFLR